MWCWNAGTFLTVSVWGSCLCIFTDAFYGFQGKHGLQDLQEQVKMCESKPQPCDVMLRRCSVDLQELVTLCRSVEFFLLSQIFHRLCLCQMISGFLLLRAHAGSTTSGIYTQISVCGYLNWCFAWKFIWNSSWLYSIQPVIFQTVVKQWTLCRSLNITVNELTPLCVMWLCLRRCCLRKASEVACLLRGGHMTVVLQG